MSRFPFFAVYISTDDLSDQLHQHCVLWTLGENWTGRRGSGYCCEFTTLFTSFIKTPIIFI